MRPLLPSLWSLTLLIGINGLAHGMDAGAAAKA